MAVGDDKWWKALPANVRKRKAEQKAYKKKHTKKQHKARMKKQPKWVRDMFGG